MSEPCTPCAEVAYLARQHNLAFPGEHTNLTASLCLCQKTQVVASRPNLTGEVCAVCGGMMVRTGTCTTCTSCGTTGGCG